MKKKKTKQVEKVNIEQTLYPQDLIDLRKQYKDKEAIIDNLCEIPVTMKTYEFLGELFFHYTLRELGQHPPSDQWIAQLKALRADVYQLYELARAAKALKEAEATGA